MPYTLRCRNQWLWGAVGAQSPAAGRAGVGVWLPVFPCSQGCLVSQDGGGRESPSQYEHMGGTFCSRSWLEDEGVWQHVCGCCSVTATAWAQHHGEVCANLLSQTCPSLYLSLQSMPEDQLSKAMSGWYQLNNSFLFHLFRWKYEWLAQSCFYQYLCLCGSGGYPTGRAVTDTRGAGAPWGLHPQLCPATRQLPVAPAAVGPDFAQCQGPCWHACCIQGALLSWPRCLCRSLSSVQYRPSRRQHGQAGGCPLRASAALVFSLSKTKAPASSPNQVLGITSKPG